MRVTYPRSFLSLLVLGFTVVAAPLLFALISNALSFERLAGLSEQGVHSAVRATQASRSVAAVIPALERSARQYAVAGEASFLDAYRANRASFRSLAARLGTMALTPAQQDELAAAASAEQGIAALVDRLGPTPELSRRLPQEFAALA